MLRCGVVWFTVVCCAVVCRGRDEIRTKTDELVTGNLESQLRDCLGPENYYQVDGWVAWGG